MHDFWFACVLFQTIWSTWMKIHQIEKTLKVNQLFWMFIVWIAVLSLFGYRRLPGSRMFCVCILFLFNDFCQPYYLNFNWTAFHAVFTVRFHYGCSWIDFRIFKGCHSCLQCFDAVGWVTGRASGLWKTSGGVVCLEWGADLHMAQLMPLPLTVSCSSKIQIGFTFLVPAYPGYPGKEAVKWLL